MTANAGRHGPSITDDPISAGSDSDDRVRRARRVLIGAQLAASAVVLALVIYVLVTGAVGIGDFGHRTLVP